MTDEKLTWKKFLFLLLKHLPIKKKKKVISISKGNNKHKLLNKENIINEIIPI